MLLEFKTKNYKSFKDEMVFSMIPDAETTGLDYSILKETVGGTEYEGLCSAVIYGPNAAGKTNIIGAMGVLKDIILRGHIRNVDVKNNPNAENNPNVAANLLELIPNNLDTINEPVSFFIRFIENNLLIEYALTVDLGGFLQETYSRNILFEELKVNEDIIFSRAENLDFGTFSHIQEYMVNRFEDNRNSVMDLAKNNLQPEELFLMNGFKSMFSGNFVKLITGWFEKKFLIIYSANDLQTTKVLDNAKKGAIEVDNLLTDATECFGASNKLAYINTEELGTELYSLIERGDEGVAVRSRVFESYGTIRFANIFPLIVAALATGGTLVVDEFDASIHPMALMNIVNIFHNDEINIHHAQLIFNTHNPIFLNGNLYRADEIKFVERDEETQYSEQYALSDFEAEETNEDRDYMRNYFISRYGAVKEIDFSMLFKELLCEETEEKGE